MQEGRDYHWSRPWSSNWLAKMKERPKMVSYTLRGWHVSARAIIYDSLLRGWGLTSHIVDPFQRGHSSPRFVGTIANNEVSVETLKAWYTHHGEHGHPQKFKWKYQNSILNAPRNQNPKTNTQLFLSLLQASMDAPNCTYVFFDPLLTTLSLQKQTLSHEVTFTSWLF